MSAHRLGKDTVGVSRALRRLAAVGVAVWCVLVGALVFVGAPALGAQTRFLEASFGPDGTAGTSFELPAAIGVDQATGDVYVGDAAAHTVQKFDAAHEPSMFTGVAANIFGSRLTGIGLRNAENEIAVNSATHDFYVAEAETDSVRAYQADGEPADFTAGPGAGTNEIGGFSELCGVAVDANGDVYAGNYRSGVSVYAPSGEPLASFADAGVCNLAVDAHGAVYANRYFGPVKRFTPSVFPVTASTVYSEAGTVDENSAAGVAVDPVSNDLLVDEQTRVAEYQEGGARVGTFGGSGAGALSGGSQGIAVNGATGRVYVSDGGAGQVEVFGPPVVLPDVVSEPASGVAPAGATLNGTVDPDGVQLADCHFAYGPSEASGSSVPCVPAAGSIPVDSNVHAVSAVVAGLTPGTVYHYRLFAGNANGGSPGQERVFGPPQAVSESAGGETKTTATLEAQVNPDGVDTTYHFEYGTTSAYGTSIPLPSSDIGAGESDVSADAELTGLRSGVTYHYRVVAVNAAGTATGEDQTFTTVPPARIDAVTVADVTASGATIQAQIDPLGTDTSYRVEYGTSTAYGSSVPVPAADIGAGTTDVAVAQQLGGLGANTTYHVRVVAQNALGSVFSVDHTFVYDTSGEGLPDGRAYELVTPPQKNGAVPGIARSEVSEDGQRVVMTLDQCFAPAGGCTAGTGASYLFSRTGSGWVSSQLVPPASQYGGSFEWAWGADAGVGLYSFETPPVGEQDFYARQPDGSYADIGPVTPPSAGVALSNEVVETRLSSVFGRLATADLSHVVWESQPVWPFDASSHGVIHGTTLGHSAYEYAGLGNAAPALVGVRGGAGSIELVSECATMLGGYNGASRGALSADGATVFFTALGQDAQGCGAGPDVPAVSELYARIDQSRTVSISQRSPLGCTGVCASSPASDAEFVGASEDGSKAFFTDTQQLTNSASEGNGTARSEGCREGAGCNLYEYDFDNPAGENLIAVSAGDTSGQGPGVQGVLGISTDGSHVYFVATGVLSMVANAQGQLPQAGRDNLYVFERDGAFPGGRVAFITTLPSVGPFSAERYLWDGGFRPDVTPDGRFLVFKSYGDLTPDDTSTSDALQVFRYDAQTGELVRISIGEHGFDDNGNTSSLPGCEEAACNAGSAGIAEMDDPSTAVGWLRAAPTMSSDGAYVFFQSPLALTPHALNDVAISKYEGGEYYAQNVYEWHEGQVYLISDGRDTSNVAAGKSSVSLLGSDGSGADVFFTTADRLVPQDADSAIDIYDARICTTGEPCMTPVAPVPCVGEGCHDTPEGAPTLLVPGSATFAGAGNLAPPSVPVAKPKAKQKAKHARRAHGKAKRHKPKPGVKSKGRSVGRRHGHSTARGR